MDWFLYDRDLRHERVKKVLILFRLKYLFHIPWKIQSAQIRSFFWSVFSDGILLKSPYSVRIQENTDRKKLRIWTLFTQFQIFSGDYGESCLKTCKVLAVKTIKCIRLNAVNYTGFTLNLVKFKNTFFGIFPPELCYQYVIFAIIIHCN